MRMELRRSVPADIEQIVRIAEAGKALLRRQGIGQWQRGTYPDRPLFLRDMEAGIGYVLSQGEEVLAVCAVTYTEEASYRTLSEGCWLTGDGVEYATIHRGAVAELHRGEHLSQRLLEEIAVMARAAGAVSLRADTHPENLAMQRGLERAGFTRCGTLYLVDGDEAGDLRYAYERVLSSTH